MASKKSPPTTVQWVRSRSAPEPVSFDTQTRVREEPGCVSFDFSEIVGERGDFVVVHEWRDEAALEAHYRSAPFLAYQEAVGDLLARPSELRVHRVRETLQPAEGEPMDPRRAD